MIDRSGYCLGAKPFVVHPAALPFFGAFSTDFTLPKLLPEVNWHQAVTGGFPMLENDVKPNCVEAGIYHGLQIWRANAYGDSVYMPLNADVDQFFSAVGTPEGTDPQRAYSYWSSVGLKTPGTIDLPFWAYVASPSEVQLSFGIQLFGWVGMCWELPRAAQSAAKWDVLPTQLNDPAFAPGSWGAHFTATGRFARSTFWTISWGEEIEMSWSFMAQYLKFSFIAFSREWLDATGVSPSLLNWDALSAAQAATLRVA